MHPLLVMVLCAVAAAQPGTVRLTVRLTDVRAEKGGVLHVALHAAPGDSFPGQSATMNRNATPGGSEAEVTFDVVPGDYAVAAHHDANRNGRMDVSLLRMPKEGWGISNDPRPRFRAPRFDDGRLIVLRDTTVIVRMTY